MTSKYEIIRCFLKDGKSKIDSHTGINFKIERFIPLDKIFDVRTTIYTNGVISYGYNLNLYHISDDNFKFIRRSDEYFINKDILEMDDVEITLRYGRELLDNNLLDIFNEESKLEIISWFRSLES